MMASHLNILLLVAVAWVAGTAAAAQSPPPGSKFSTEFPFCGCATKSGAYSPSAITAHGDGKYCFKVLTQSCDKPCCKADLRKIELNIHDSCVIQPRPLVRVTVNGVPTRIGPSFTRVRNAPAGSAVLKFTQLGLNLTTAAGAEVCITLLPNRLGQGCNTLETLCKPPAGSPAGVCSIAMFDTSNKCCPLSTVGGPATPPSRPPPFPPLQNSGGRMPPPDLPSPPPSPAPPSPPPPCKSCIFVKLTPPAIDVTPFRFTAASCAAIQTMMASQLNAQAATPGSGVTMPMLQTYTVDPALCEPLQVGVCGQFFSAADGAALAGWADKQAASWLAAVTGNSSTCSAALDGYNVAVTSKSSACPLVEKTLSCSPPPNVVNPFPGCKCNRTRGTTPFTASPTATVEPGRTSNTALYCFTINVLAPGAMVQSTCGVSDGLHKMEFWADDTRSRAVTGIQLRPAGGPSSWISPTWASKGEMSLKATPMNWSAQQAQGGKVCLEVLRSVPLGELCMGPVPNQCYVGFFNDNRKCCPIYRTEVTRS